MHDLSGENTNPLEQGEESCICYRAGVFVTEAKGSCILCKVYIEWENPAACLLKQFFFFFFFVPGLGQNLHALPGSRGEELLKIFGSEDGKKPQY